MAKEHRRHKTKRVEQGPTTFALGFVMPRELLKIAAGDSKAKYKWLKRRYRKVNHGRQTI